MRRATQLALVFMIGAVALFLALREVEIQPFLQALRSVRLDVFALGFLSFSLLHLLRALRWGGLVRAVRPEVRFRSYVSICSVGFMLINVLPFRLGEFARPYLLFEREGVPFGSGMATVVVERVLDIAALGAIFAAVLLWADVPGYLVELPGRAEPFDIVQVARTGILSVLVPATVAILALLVLGEAGIALLVRVSERVPGRLLRLPLELGVRFLRTFLVALRSLGSLRRATGLLASTAALWALNVLSIYFTVRAFPFGDVVDLAGAATILVVICVALIAPAPPGFAGVFEFACTVALALFSIGASEAAAFALVLHGSQFVLVTGVGGAFLAVDRISVRRLLDVPRRLKSGELGGA